MNCKEINNFPIEEFLSKIGFNPVKINKNELFYKSPFRIEKEASFIIYKNNNLFVDFGESNKSGHLIDFIVKYYNCSVKDGIQIFNNLFSFYKPLSSIPDVNIEADVNNAADKKEKNITITSIKSSSLFDYIESRLINFKFAKKYLKEISYKQNNKFYFGLGFINQSGGYSFRNQYFKSNIGKNDISLIINENTNIINIFEGFFDFLSYLTLFPDKDKNESFIILNSLTNLKKALNYCKDKFEINLFLDNDTAGIKAKNELNIKYNDKSNLYHNCKDFNEYLIFKKYFPNKLGIESIK